MRVLNILQPHALQCADLHGLPHYRMAFANPWAWEDEAVAEAMRKKMFKEVAKKLGTEWQQF